MHSVNLSYKNTKAIIDLFNFKNEMNVKNFVENGSYDKTKDLFDSTIDFSLNQIDKKEGFQISEGIEVIETGYDLAKVGYSGIIAAEATGTVAVGLAFSLIGALALAIGIAAIPLGIAMVIVDVENRGKSKGIQDNNLDDFLEFANKFSDFMRGKDLFGSVDRLGDRGSKLGELSQTDTPLSHQNDSERE